MPGEKKKKYDWFPYHVGKYFNIWAVYKFHSEKRMSAEKIQSFADYNEAKQEAYRLNNIVNH